MAKINSSIIGSLSGRIGNLVAVTSKGKTYLREYKPPTDHKTERQLIQRSRFALAMNTLRPFRPIIAETYGTGQSNYAKAMSLFLKTAIQGDYPDYAVAWNKVIISPNKLMLPLDIRLEHLSPEKLIVKWNSMTWGNSSPDDVVSLIVYNAGLTQIIYHKGLASRGAGEMVFESFGLDNAALKFWVLFTSSKKRKPSVAWFCNKT
jgi:hypothetical protein